MTIAACYLSPEGVVLGADSTTTMFFDQPGTTGRLPHYFNYAQKLFEISNEPETESIGLVTWGLGSLGAISHRSLVGRFADDLASTPANTLLEAANRWTTLFWNEWSNLFAALISRVQSLKGNASRTPQEEEEFQRLLGLGTGFCLGGYCPGDNRAPGAYEIIFDPRNVGPPTPTALTLGWPAFWGVPNMIKRLLFGTDENLVPDVLSSGKWNGSEADLRAILNNYYLVPSIMPIRDAIDFVHAGIYSTIKGLKFSNLSQVCGGPIEIAVITSDRKFRWVRHKRFDEAITEQEGGV